MQTTFTTEFIKENCGCYRNEPNKLSTVYNENDKSSCYEQNECQVTADDILNSSIPLKDKYWFFCKKVFTKEQNQQIAILVAECVLPFYESKYPENKAPREAIEAAKLYIAGHISFSKLMEARRAAAYDAATAYAAADAYAYAAAYAAAAYAAYAAAYDTADAYDDDAAYAAADVYDAAYAATAYAADAYAADAYAAAKQQLLKILVDFIEENK